MRDLYKYAYRIFILTLAAALAACAGGGSEASEEVKEAVQPNDTIDIVTTNMNFIAPDTIPSGWLTLRFVNKSDMVHFAVLEHFPVGKHVDDTHREVAPVFQNIMDQINGKPLSAPDAGTEAPEWFKYVIIESGAGLVSPGHIAETTVKMDPGTYVIECYLKTNGVFHSYNPDPEIYGMLHEFCVTVDPSTGVAPQPTFDVNISTENGIEILTKPSAGLQTIAVHFLDQKVYSNFSGHDVHLARIQDTTDLEQLSAWMDWTKPDGLQTPAPPVVFLGGTHEMTKGETGYFTVTLTPGRYAFVSEIPDPLSLGMLRTFEVPEG